MAHPPLICARWWPFENREGNVMNRIRHIRRLIEVLAALAGALLGLGALTPAAFAGPITLPPHHGDGGPAAGTGPVHTVIVGGMPGWQIALIAVGAAVLAAAVAVPADRARAARRQALSPAA
jgi:hypothetical protein